MDGELPVVVCIVRMRHTLEQKLQAGGTPLGWWSGPRLGGVGSGSWDAPAHLVDKYTNNQTLTNQLRILP